MRIVFLAAVIAAIVTVTQVRAQLVLNDLSSHAHGYGDLFIQFQDTAIFMVLEVPAWDIAGFEGEPKSKEQIEKVEASEDKLFEALELFEAPQTAECSVNRSSVTRIAETLETDDNVEEETPAGQSETTDLSSKSTSSELQLHSAFIAEYSIICKHLDQFDELTFTYFDKFPNAMALTVIISTQKGEFFSEVDRTNNTLNLKELR